MLEASSIRTEMRVLPLLKTNGPENGILRINRQTEPGIIPKSASFELRSGRLQVTKSALFSGFSVISGIKLLI